MLLKPLLHGSYVDDLFLGVVFFVMLAVFLYFYFFDKGKEEGEPPDPPSASDAQNREEN